MDRVVSPTPYSDPTKHLTTGHRTKSYLGQNLIARRPNKAVFYFLYFKKLKFQKYMSVLKYFKNIPRPPSHRATGPKCNFFLQICNEVPGGKKRGACRPPNGRQGPVAHPSGDRVLSPYGGATGPTFFCFFPGTYFELFERVFVIIVGKISAANSYRT